MTWRHRDISDDVLRGLFLLLEASSKQHDGVHITNHCLQSILNIKRVSTIRARSFASEIRHVFPYSDVRLNSLHATVLILGLKKETEPTNLLRVDTMPPLPDIETRLGIESVVWSCNRTRMQ